MMVTIKNTCFSFLFILPLVVSAQLEIERAVIGAAASHLKGDLIVDGTMGEVLIGYDAGSDLIITSGFHQETSPMTSAPNPETISLQIYPNPTADKFSLKGNVNAHPLKLELVDVQGRILYADSFRSVNKEINISAFSPGLYILLIRDIKGAIIDTRSIVKLD